MINKQNMWFVTLFSLILVLSIYYITMPDNALADLNVNGENFSKEIAEIQESTALVALRVQADEEILAEMETLQTILLSESATINEKNDAYETLRQLNSNKGKEEEIQNKIKEAHKLDSFVKIKNDQISVVIANKDHNDELANNIIRTVQGMYETKMYITVKFQ